MNTEREYHRLITTDLGHSGIRDLFDSVPEGVIAFGPDGVVFAANPAAEALFGLPGTLTGGVSVQSLLRPWPTGLGGEYTALLGDGGEQAVEVTLAPCGSSGHVAVIRDRSERRNAEGRLAAIVDASPDAVYSLDREGLITSWNRSAQLIFGFGPLVALGRPGRDLIADRSADEYDVLFRRVLDGEPHPTVDLFARHRDGFSVPVALTMCPLRDRRGRTVGVSVVARDLTEQHDAMATLAESEQRLREGERLAHVGGWVLDAATGTVQWSEELHRIHGVDPGDFDADLASHLAPVAPQDKQGLDDAIRAATENGRAFELEYRIVRADGAERWIYCRAQPALDSAGEVIGLRGICQDITERRLAESAVRQAYEREREAAEGLRAADALKDEFLATVSHELRTPLTAILGFSHLLAGGAPDLVPELSERIERNASEMLEMVERLLDFSRIQAGKVKVEPMPVHLDELISDALDQVVDRMGQHRVCRMAPDLVVRADRRAMFHVLSNLLSNAVKFAEPGTDIEIMAEVSESMAVVGIRDHGPGVPPHLAEQVFDRFFQAPDQRSGRRGAGVGLAIVRRYVELQNGQVWYEPAAGGGALFRFSLPLAEAAG